MFQWLQLWLHSLVQVKMLYTQFSMVLAVYIHVLFIQYIQNSCLYTFFLKNKSNKLKYLHGPVKEFFASWSRINIYAGQSKISFTPESPLVINWFVKYTKNCLPYAIWLDQMTKIQLYCENEDSIFGCFFFFNLWTTILPMMLA